jgi:hypothetical protein
METGKAYPIGDRNWAAWDVSHDIPHLAVRKVMARRWFGISLMLRLIGRKVDDTPIFEFGILRGATFKKIDITKIEVYGTEIKRFVPPPSGFFGFLWNSLHSLARFLLIAFPYIAFGTCFFYLIFPIVNVYLWFSLLVFSAIGLGIYLKPFSPDSFA